MKKMMMMGISFLLVLGLVLTGCSSSQDNMDGMNHQNMDHSKMQNSNP